MIAEVPHIHFDADLLPVEDRFDTWRQGIVPFEVERCGDLSTPFRARIDAWMFGGMALTSGTQSAARFTRTAERARSDAQDSLNFVFLRQGAWTGDAGDRLLSVGPGDLAVLDLAGATMAETTDLDSVTVTVARSALHTIDELPDLHGRILEQGAGRMLADHFVSLVRFLPSLDSKVLPALTQATLGLITASFAALPSSDRREASPVVALRHQVKRHVDRNLNAADLSPARIGRDLEIARSSLYRAFAPLGGIASYVQRRRLEAVHALLADPREGRTIADIAESFGFVSVAHFSNAFRVRFGYSPRDVRLGTGRFVHNGRPVANGDDPAVFGEWMRALNAG